MTQDEKRQFLTLFMTGLQKYRSNAQEGTAGIGGEFALPEIWPHVFGESCPLPMIEKVLVKDRISGQDFYNLMVFLHVLIPQVKVFIEYLYEIKFPEPSPAMVLDDFS